MIVGIFEIRMKIPWKVYSLKEKRAIIRPVKETLLNKFNISLREIDPDDKFNTATLGLSYVALNMRELDTFESKMKENIYENDLEIIEIKRRLA